MTSHTDLEKTKTLGKQRDMEASKTAEVKFQSMVSSLLTSGADETSAEQTLEGRKKLLENWVAKILEKTRGEVESKEEERNVVLKNFEGKVKEMVHSSHEEFTKRKQEDLQVDDALLKELEESLEVALAKPPKPAVVRQASVTFSPTVRVRPAERPDQAEPPQQEATVPPPAPEEVPEQERRAAATMGAAEAVLRRKDTTQLNFQRSTTAELEEKELEKCAVQMPDGATMYKNAKGKLETREQRDKRLAHNTYVSFSRSFEGTLTF